MPRAAPNLKMALRCGMPQSGPKNPSTIPRRWKLIFIGVKNSFTGWSKDLRGEAREDRPFDSAQDGLGGGVLFCTLTRNGSSAPFDKAHGERQKHMCLFQQPVHDSPIWHIEEKLTRFSCQ